MQLVWPSIAVLPGYIAALERGWSPDTLRPQAAREELDKIEADPQAFVASLLDREAKGPPITLPDGSKVRRLPGYRRWIFDSDAAGPDDFCGSLSFRWQDGTPELPAHVLGHIGYAVVPWKQRRGYATRALAMQLDTIRSEATLPYVEITTDPENFASQRVIEANGGVLVERFIKSAQYGNKPGLRYRIAIT